MKYSAVFSTLVGVGVAEFNVLEHLGANSPWFTGPNVFGIPNEVPVGCTVDQAVYIVRHGSRYPDPGAYAEWVDLHEKLQAQEFTADGSLQFLPDWKPVLDDPAQQLAQLSPGGYDELYHLGVELRTRYPGWYKYGSPFHVWANNYQRTIDSARLFARGYGGPNATTLGTVKPILSTDSSAVGNSLATSDSCPAYEDNSGAGYIDEWDSIYLPPIATRLNQLIKGNLSLTTDDISKFPYLCGFESQILRKVSPFCGVFTEAEILQYEYRQDLRYYYGTGPGSYHNASVMLPVIQGVIDILRSGPETPLVGANNGEEILGELTVAFTHDNQLNQLVSSMGLFDRQQPLPSDSMDPRRIYVSSRNNPMRGTVAFERLRCHGTSYLRVLLNDAVYPVTDCSEGPGKSCPLDKYDDKILAEKWKNAGSFEDICGLADGVVTTSKTGGVTFFTNFTMPAISSVKP
ncbi:multiple inositol-polyphosphate phosphatase / 2,3-bisphosphoglycerate 3-phosphatase [Geosmithia morbida]|uniref:3-phytase n=1 Tax=Geosmithia morbida TaxID=1094350 RepID=A0A9P4YP86_9HYPO|nr:multiple inositol-polyphosphate phosphatase / 2,3-bisphosphoglycerate 3-phosphatase [Geosmithia morbida]KAF4120608.1 multiple inositol-polyphosphate phosphatase / 2,3-bisphosphoglycerate 3-phosphatase [Geosmithia morbida]